jgi:hypothetical protein
MNISVIDEVVGQLKSMPYSLQWQVLEFTKSLMQAEVRGTSGKQLVRLAGSISTDDIELMAKAIEQGCEQVDVHEW